MVIHIIDKTIYRDVFNFHEERLAALNKCPDAELEAYWDQTIDAMMGIAAKHGKHLLCVDLLVAVHADLEREYFGRAM